MVVKKIKNKIIGDVFGVIAIILLVFVVSIIFTTLKEVSPNDKTTELIEKQEQSFFGSINFYLALGTVSSIGFFIFIGYKIYKWADKKFGNDRFTNQYWGNY